MLDQIILFPYWLTLRLRHALYDHGVLLKSKQADVPTICVGNIAAGGTGKTPHVEMLLRSLSIREEWKNGGLAVLSRGYKRKSKGFQQVREDGLASFCGDEPLQIKRNCPYATVAVCRDRVEGCSILAHPEKLESSAYEACADKDFPPAGLIVLDDAFQHRKIKADVNIVLVDYSRTPDRDHLIPLGRLRDLPMRLEAADILIVTKCPAYMTDEEKAEMASHIGLRDYSPETCEGVRKNGLRQKVYFTNLVYDILRPVFPNADTRYIYSKKMILFTGIAKDTPVRRYLSDNYKIVKSFSFPDHHVYSKGDMSAIGSAVKTWPTAAVCTTQKDACRVRDLKKVSPVLQERLFELPVRVEFLSPYEREDFEAVVVNMIRRS